MIYYSHVNEDNEVEKIFMDSDNFHKLIGVAGSGERIIALMAHPFLQKVEAIDTNIEALFLLEIKLKALEYLEVEDYLSFIGFSNSQQRLALFSFFKNKLSTACRAYWEERLKVIEEGILFYGHFEQFLNRFRPLFKLFLGKQFYQCFLHPTAAINRFPHWRWALVKKVFSQRWAFQLGGNKDKAFISSDAEWQQIPQGLQKVLDENLVSQSFMFHLVFKGNLKDMDSGFLPPSLKKENLHIIKQALQTKQIEISYHHQDLKDYLESMSSVADDHNFYSLSDILSFCDFDYLKKTLRIISAKKGEKNWGVVRAFIRNRLSEKEIKAMKKEVKDLQETSHLEKTKMYQVINFKV